MQFLREVTVLHYKSYQNMRDATWKILLDCGIDRLPVDIDTVCEKLGICVLSYDAGAEVIERAHLYRVVRDINGLTFYLGNTPVILFNERQEVKQIMFTVAHELGHIILKHVSPGDTTPAHQGPEWNATPKEGAANQFAVRLLAPACVLWGLDIHTPEEIMKWCQITRPAAERRARRMTTLYQRQKFLTSPLERKLHHQFQPYLEQAAPLSCLPGA